EDLEPKGRAAVERLAALEEAALVGEGGGWGRRGGRWGEGEGCDEGCDDEGEGSDHGSHSCGEGGEACGRRGVRRVGSGSAPVPDGVEPGGDEHADIGGGDAVVAVEVGAEAGGAGGEVGVPVGDVSADVGGDDGVVLVPVGR